MSTILEREKIEETTVEIESESGDHDRFKHYFRNKDVEEAVFTGKPATALCGKKSIPMDDTSKYELCQTCKERYELLAG